MPRRRGGRGVPVHLFFGPREQNKKGLTCLSRTSRVRHAHHRRPRFRRVRTTSCSSPPAARKFWIVRSKSAHPLFGTIVLSVVRQHARTTHQLSEPRRAASRLGLARISAAMGWVRSSDQVRRMSHGWRTPRRPGESNVDCGHAWLVNRSDHQLSKRDASGMPDLRIRSISFLVA